MIKLYIFSRNSMTTGINNHKTISMYKYKLVTTDKIVTDKHWLSYQKSYEDVTVAVMQGIHKALRSYKHEYIEIYVQSNKIKDSIENKECTNRFGRQLYKKLKDLRNNNCTVKFLVADTDNLINEEE